MADRQDLLLARKVEDLRRKVFELAVIIGEPHDYDSPAGLADLANPRGSVRAWRGCRTRCARRLTGLIGLRAQQAGGVTPISGFTGARSAPRDAASGFCPPFQGSSTRLGPLDYSGLRGEGSNPVPLPPPATRAPRLLLQSISRKSPNKVMLFESCSCTGDCRVAAFSA